jgi:hypothetical protein
MEIYKTLLCLIMQYSNVVHHIPSWSYINGIFIHRTYPIITYATQASLFHKLVVGFFNPHYLYRGVFLIQSMHLHKIFMLTYGSHMSLSLLTQRSTFWLQYDFNLQQRDSYFRCMSWSSMQNFLALWIYWRIFMIHIHGIYLYLVPLPIQHNDIYSVYLSCYLHGIATQYFLPLILRC